MLHMDIIKERLLREYDIETIFTTPTVVYLVKSKQLSLEVIKTGRNIKELMKTGYFAHVLKHELSDEEYKKLAPRLLKIADDNLGAEDLKIVEEY